MTIERDASEKLKVMSFVGSVLVVAQHSYAQATFVQSLVTQSFTRLAVPFFFIVSGLLLYRDYECSARWAKAKVLSRCRTLLVPYFAWAVIVLLFSEGVSVQSARDVLDVLGITNASPYDAGHLWYVRTLFLFVLFAVPLAFFLKRLRWLVPAGVLFLFAVCLRGANCYSMCYFSIGSLLALSCPTALDRKLPAWTVPLLAGAGVALLLVRTLAFREVVEIPFPVPVFKRLTEFLLVAALLPAAWRTCDFVRETRTYKWLLRLAPSAFFVYCLHPYAARLFPSGAWWVLRVALTVAVCEAAYWTLRRLWPSSLTVLSGGR